jgi:hypothetical protein
MTVRVGYNTPIFSETSEDLFEVFKSIVDEFSSDEEENLESYLEKGKHFLYRDEMHVCVILRPRLDGESCAVVTALFSINIATSRSTVSHCFVFDMACGSQNGDASSSSSSPIGSGSSGE